MNLSKLPELFLLCVFSAWLLLAWVIVPLYVIGLMVNSWHW